MTFVKRYLVKKRTKGRIEISERIKGLVKDLLLSIIDIFVRLWVLANLYYSPMRLAERLTQKLYWIQDFGVIGKDKSLNMIFLNKMTNLLDIEFLKL